MKIHRVPASVFGYSMIFCLQAVQGVEIPKLFNNTALNLPGAWTGGAIPGATDIAVWNINGPPPVNANTLLSTMGADLTFSGIKVTDVSGTRNLANAFIGFHSPSSAQTLTIGADGIDCSAALQTLYGSSKITLGADQLWKIANANTNGSPAGNNNNEDVIFQAQVVAAPFNFNGKKITTSGDGQVTITSGYTLSNGTLDVGNNLFVIQGGSSRNTTLNANLNLIVTAGTLRIQANSGVGGVSMASASPITVNGGTLEFNNTNNQSMTQSGNITLHNGTTLGGLFNNTGSNTVTGAIAVDGTVTFRTSGTANPSNGLTLQGNLSGSGAINYQNTATAANGHINLTGDNSGYTGTLTLNGASGNSRLRIGTANSGSAAATWNVAINNTLQVNGVTTQLGTLNGAGTVTNSSAATPATLNVGAGAFSGIISNGASQLTALTKVGLGTLTLSGPSTYSGLTTVSAGKLSLSTLAVPTTAANYDVADGAAFAVAQAQAGFDLAANQLTVGATTGATFELAFGSLSNPISAPFKPTTMLVNGASILQVSGTNLTVGTFPVIQYGTLAGSSGYGGLTLKLPARTTGSLSNASNTISVTIATTQQVKWVGNVSDNWDLDPDGTQTLGTPNWITTVTNASTRYLQGTGGTDVVNFDDSATGTGTVNLTTSLSPGGLTVNNPSKAYTFTGAGKITGSTGLVKSGAGSLTLANTTANDYSGGTVINAGTLRLGDGVTPGAGTVPGSIVNDGKLVLNHPNDNTFSNPLSGLGTLEKAASNTVTIGSLTFFNPLILTAGKLLFNAGGSLSGPISGGGQLEAAGGTLTLEGFDANTNTGLVTVSSGSLRLNKSADIAAVGGDITIQGTGTLAIINNEQIPNTATVNVLGSSTDSFIGSTGTETFANANLSGTSPDTQLILRNFPVITGTATVTQGILGVGSGNTATINAVVLNSATALLRISGNTGASVLNVGSGGITASAGDIQVKFNANDQDATLNLEGGLTATGNLTISNGGYGGSFLNVINLSTGAHTFNIATSTTTTVSPDFGGDGSLVKSGAGTLTLNPTSVAAQLGGTAVNQGILIVNGSVTGTTNVAVAGTIGGTGTLAGTTTVQGTVAPGVTTGTLTTTAPITLDAGSAFAVDVANWTGVTPGTDWDQLSASTLTLAATVGNKLTIRIAGSPVDFAETAKTLAIATSTNPISGFNAAAIAIDATGFVGAGTWTVQQTGSTIELVYAPAAVSAYSAWATANSLDGSNNGATQDPDNDGSLNFMEFAFNSVPLSGASSGKVSGKVATVGAEQALTLTLPVRSSAAFTGATEKSLSVDGLTYHVQGSDALGAWTLEVTEVTGTDATTIQATLPALQSGWFYRTFRSPGPVVGDPTDFLRVSVENSN